MRDEKQTYSNIFKSLALAIEVYQKKIMRKMD